MEDNRIRPDNEAIQRTLTHAIVEEDNRIECLTEDALREHDVAVKTGQGETFFLKKKPLRDKSMLMLFAARESLNLKVWKRGNLFPLPSYSRRSRYSIRGKKR